MRKIQEQVPRGSSLVVGEDSLHDDDDDGEGGVEVVDIEYPMVGVGVHSDVDHHDVDGNYKVHQDNHWSNAFGRSQ